MSTFWYYLIYKLENEIKSVLMSQICLPVLYITLRWMWYRRGWMGQGGIGYLRASVKLRISFMYTSPRCIESPPLILSSCSKFGSLLKSWIWEVFRAELSLRQKFIHSQLLPTQRIRIWWIFLSPLQAYTMLHSTSSQFTTSSQKSSIGRYWEVPEKT